MTRTRTILLAGLAGFALLLTACGQGSAPAGNPDAGNGDGDTSEETQVVRLGVVGASDPYWPLYEAAVEAELGIDLEIVNFGEYPLPNPALSAGEIDINQFQHIIYLAQHNVASGDDLTVIGSTATYPLGIHSLQFDSVEDIPEGSTVAIPNDPTNGARALLVLQQAGLIQLENGGSTLSTPDEILPSSKVRVTELDAAFTATTLNDVAAAVINNDFVEKAGLDFADALFQDDPNDPSALPYVNIFAVKAEDSGNEIYHRLVEIYHSSQDVLDSAFQVSGETAVFVNTPAADLQQALTVEEENVRNAG